MALLILLICFIVSASATTPPKKDDGAVPPLKPGPIKPRLCPLNEVLKLRPPCPPDDCSMIYVSVLCIANQTESYVCTCKEGYLRTNSTPSGVCVPTDRCLPSECADDPNAVRGCGNRCGKTCADYSIPNKTCANNVCNLYGCDCKEGYVYDENIKKCVQPNQCTKQCKKPHERYSACLLGECVPKTCDQLGYPIACPGILAPCEGGCICEEGYVSDCKGNCIETSKCPRCGGDPNAVSGCGNPCGKTCASLYVNASDIVCPQYCEINGCDCRPGYRILSEDNRDPKKCVPVSECPKPSKQCKGPHEKYIDCPAGQCNPKTCDDLVTPPGCPRIRPPCPGGCVCEEGYLKNSKGICIKKEQCPSVQCKKPHERYSNCLLGECVPKTCDDVGYPVACPDIIGPCAGGCTCEEGYVRDYKGNCIDMKNCPSCGGDPNAVSGCGNPCGKTCASLYANSSDLVCPQYCEYNGCDCKPGYRLLNADAETKKCVPEKECPKPCQQCGKNEEYYCGASCPEATCTNPKPRICINMKCKLACFCKKGFVRDATNKCVPIDKCPAQCKGLHEKYIDCPAGQCNAKTCEDLITPPGCPRIIPPCPGGCVCEDGYLKNAKGICIKKEDCPQHTCSTNQTYVSCNAKCPDKYCPKDDQPQPVCDPPRECLPGCTCKINYRYDQSGKCILASECPPVNCTGQNTEWDSCPSACLAEQCEDADSPPVVCNTLLLNCQPKCVCKKWHYKNKDGVCVPAKECPYVCKDPNASWKDCKDACPATCQNTRPGCVNKMCSPGCQCNDGYVLTKEGGKCVKVETCAEYAECPANQTFVSCTFKCPQVVCPTSDLTILCKPPRDCPGGCGCKPYYRYNPEGDCVKASDCPPVKCTRPNEIWTSCQRISDWERCEDRYNSPPFNPGDPDDCKPKCVCKKGFWRNDANKCVPEKECYTGLVLVPLKPVETIPRKCPENEVLKSKKLCPPDSCDTQWLSFLCAAEDTESVICTCKDGYLRTNSTSSGVCVPADRCLPPECADDPNAKRGCGNRCGKTCADYNDKSKVCNNKLVCKLFGCDCKDGFVYDDNIKKCVKPDQCSKPCKKPHERYSSCLLGECVAKTCAQLGYPVACPHIADPCAGGCICEEGYVRDCNGDCIEKNKCPSCGGDPNAVSGCGNPCGKTCASLYANTSDLVCPQYCEYNGCDCKPGYRLLSADSESKKCVPEKECPKPPKQCGENEEYYCGTSCAETTCVNPKPPTCVNKKCKLACFCKKGFVRDANKKCVPVDKCPKPSCRSNQTYVSCNANCPDKYCPKDDKPQPVCDPPRDCSPGCTCKINYRYDQSGKCILASECPPVNCTGQNMEWDSCPSACLAEQCEDADSPPVVCNTLLLNCQPKCVCKKWHFKNKDGVCVPAKECPSVCKDPNASWIDCKDACPATCQNTRPGCVNKMCSPGCQCNDGYVLTKEGGKCVKVETCAEYAECPANQTFVECTFKCPQVMCPESDETILCKPPRDCPGGCGCKPNYRYNANGDCINGSDCPPVECTRPNEEWAPCRSEYDWERCEDRYNTPPIVPDDPEDCNPRCVCKNGFWKNNLNECVPENECPQ